ncbi:hypothetical protein ORV05_09025 [Amycolatopsis cynarae]|uniref:DUF427 domain-containing protein n=1 Tax=Amycolatopsis cynarae TaxID=2995223 RepID=A0ABY7B7H0_9PSEU|nr:hypothetical protein [Amycolatopsis sp. HUAS 11-8]WAL67895.1 hypothetical protein ORV05_09025 [Amycolatopsis sp. HUAS 11-8]
MPLRVLRFAGLEPWRTRGESGSMADREHVFATERRALLAEGNRLKAHYAEVGFTAGGKAAIYRVFDLHDRYEELLPESVVARCPFTGSAVPWPIDSVDLDGWYWDYDNPARRLRGRVLPTWLAMGGAVRLAEPVASAPFFCMPGPDAPYVVPRLLAHPQVRAVVAQLPIGPHTGWAVTYFGTRRHLGVDLENLWGTRRYEVYYDNGCWKGWAGRQQHTGDYDFDLGPWLDSGKLLWIAPDDSGATLREGLPGCPYVDLGGTRKLQMIHDGKITRY